jgi:hypothetical protein
MDWFLSSIQSVGSIWLCHVGVCTNASLGTNDHCQLLEQIFHVSCLFTIQLDKFNFSSGGNRRAPRAGAPGTAAGAPAAAPAAS